MRELTDPAAVVTRADRVLAAIINNDFWIITHPEWIDVMQARVAGMQDSKLVVGFGGWMATVFCWLLRSCGPEIETGG